MDPCARKISHAVGHLSLGTTTPEPSFLEHMLRDSRSHRNEKTKHPQSRGAHAHYNYRKPVTATRTQHNPRERN